MAVKQTFPFLIGARFDQLAITLKIFLFIEALGLV